MPLFAFASKDDADKLETIADEVLGTEEEAPASRYGTSHTVLPPRDIEHAPVHQVDDFAFPVHERGPVKKCCS